ncbi:1,2-dihydroxy-3-keto-5-methylthiopentene dioxygenase [Kaarinaea lacus]
MTALTIYSENTLEPLETYKDFAAIASVLKDVGVQFERWQANQAITDDASQDEVLAAYNDSVEKLNQQFDFQSVDVVALQPDNPKKEEMRQKFLAEHTHADFEIRFFVYGSGLFYLHIDDKVYFVLCEKGDLISVPANTTHWFDMGENPNFKCIRFFTTADGWVGNFTGSDIATRFPSYDEYRGSLS